MDVELEIQAPGLDLHPRRLNPYIIFMDRVHQPRIAACVVTI